jgi:catechol 2,3-dioxygenase-like lactoylglutathione lyase family enzyme
MVISGIQQIGIGVSDVYNAWEWYRKRLGFDIPIFDDSGTAGFMLPYTGGVPQKRHAVLAVNMQGGGGLEIWQYTSRNPQFPKSEILAGDLGIYAAKIKSKDIKTAYVNYSSDKLNVLGDLVCDPSGNNCFFIRDPSGNIFQVVEHDTVFDKTNSFSGGVCGVVIGVSDIEKSILLYKNILKYDLIIYDKAGCFKDLSSLPGGSGMFCRMLLGHSMPRRGSFSRILGDSKIELVQSIGRKPEMIFKDRFWGDPGFIHLCYDVQGMDDLEKECDKCGFPFKVDSKHRIDENNAGSFDMGDTSGRFAYIEDNDGTLIEFVETHRIPVIKKIGWYMDLKGRDPEKPISDWMLKTMKLNRKK